MDDSRTEVVAASEVVRSVTAMVAAYCRGRAGDAVHPSAADDLAVAIVRASVRPTEVAFAATTYSALDWFSAAYPEAVRACDETFGTRPSHRTMTTRAREILVLRVVVGLDVDHTAWLVGCSPERVVLEQHDALAVMRRVLRHAS